MCHWQWKGENRFGYNLYLKLKSFYDQVDMTEWMKNKENSNHFKILAWASG